MRTYCVLLFVLLAAGCTSAGPDPQPVPLTNEVAVTNFQAGSYSLPLDPSAGKYSQ